LVITNYAIKRVEAKVIRTNTAIVIAIFLYKYILIRFGCPLTIVTDQGVNFMNDAIKYLIEQFMLKHVSSTTYYPQGNGQAKFIEEIIGRLLTKLINEKKTNWDEHLSTILFSYRIAYKVATCYTPYQLVYDLHPLMLIEYVLPAISGDHIFAKLTKVLTTRVTELKKLQENILEAHNNVGTS
jgi:hypothetical protein